MSTFISTLSRICQSSALLTCRLTAGVAIDHEFRVERNNTQLQLDPANFESPVISNSKPFPLDLPFSHLLSAISNSRYFELFFVAPESSK